MKRNRMLTVLAIAAAALIPALYINSPAHTRAAGPQDLLMLDRRVSTIEQRIYSIDSRLNQLEQQIRLSQRTPEPAPAPAPVNESVELRLLRSELELLASRIRLLECGVVQLDERTLPERVREARKKAGQPTDSCRANPDNPIQFPRWR